MLGPLLPALMARWHIQDAQAGTLFSAVFAGQVCGAWFGTRNLRGSVLYGSCITAVGCALVAWASFGIAHVALFFLGLGLGGGLTAGNVIAGTVLPAARTRVLAMLNAVWGVGAIACSFLVRACGPDRLYLFFLVLAACFALIAAFAIVLPRAAQDALPVTGSDSAKIKRRLPLPIVQLVIFAAVMLLFVGIENSLGGWLPSYGVRSTATLLASTIALYFWASEMTGRMLLAALTNLFGEAALYRVSISLLILTVMALIFVRRPGAEAVVALTILSGISLAPIYPLMLSFFLARTGSHPRIGGVFAGASLGGATLPWLTGVVSTHFHGLRAGLAVPLVGAMLLLSLSAAVTRKPELRLAQDLPNMGD